VLLEAGRGAGSAFERDAAFVLRRIADAVADVRAADQGNRRAFLDLIGRVMTRTAAEAESTPPEPTRLIVP
jgi:hypothetical protein